MNSSRRSLQLVIEGLVQPRGSMPRVPPGHGIEDDVEPNVKFMRKAETRHFIKAVDALLASVEQALDRVGRHDSRTPLHDLDVLDYAIRRPQERPSNWAERGPVFINEAGQAQHNAPALGGLHFQISLLIRAQHLRREVGDLCNRRGRVGTSIC